MMNVAVVGTGYVGLVAGTRFAELGHRVVCVDNDQKKLETLRTGKLPIYEPGLEEMVPKNVARGRLAFTDDLAKAVRDFRGRVHRGRHAAWRRWLGGSALRDRGGRGDRRRVERLQGRRDEVDGADRHLRQGPRGSSPARARNTSRSCRTPSSCAKASRCPTSCALDRIIVGASDDSASSRSCAACTALTADGAKFLLMDVRSSEMTKYASNSMRLRRASRS